jgi:hypothetical protein
MNDMKKSTPSEPELFSLAYRRHFLLRLGGGLLLIVLLSFLGLYCFLNRPFGGNYLEAITELDRLRMMARWAVGITLLVQLVFFSSLIFLISLFWTHKIAGPLYRLRLTFERLSHGDWTPMARVRDGDQLQEIPPTLNAGMAALRDQAAARREELSALQHDIIEFSHASHVDTARSARRLEQLKSRLRRILADDYWRIDG